MDINNKGKLGLGGRIKRLTGQEYADPSLV